MEYTCVECGDTFEERDNPGGFYVLRAGHTNALCNDCAQDIDTPSYIYCVECDEFKEADLPIRFPATGAPYLCEDHVTVSPDGSVEIDECGICGEAGTLGLANSAGDRLCRPCRRDAVYFRCVGCSEPYLVDDDNFDRDTELCSNCDFPSPAPDYFDCYPGDWDYDPSCRCPSCNWLHENNPEEYPPRDQPPLTERDICGICTGVTHGDDRWNDNLGMEICRRCEVQELVNCDACGAEIANDVAETPLGGRPNDVICEECIEERDDVLECQGRCGQAVLEGNTCACEGTYGYQYTPDRFTFLSADNEPTHDRTPYMGFELEIEAAEADASKLLASHMTKDYDWLYPVHDGSLNNGLEIISHPFTFEWFRRNFETIEEILNNYHDRGFRAFTVNTCGMHIHLSKGSMTRIHRLKLIKLVYEYRGLSCCIGQRGPASRGIRDYASFDREDSSRLPEKVRRDDNLGHDHYVAVNLEKRTTAELRFFKGTLRPRGFRKNIEYTRAAWEFTRKAGRRETNATNFVQYVQNNRHRFECLADYLDENYLTEVN